MYNQSAYKAMKKYSENTIDTIQVRIKKGYKDEWAKKAEKQQLSLNQYVIMNVNQYLEETKDLYSEK